MNKQSNNIESVLAVVLLLLVMFQITNSKYFIIGAIFLIVVCLVFGQAAVFIDMVWRKLTHYLGIVSSSILFSLLFFLIFFPVGLLLKLFKKGSFIRYSPTLTSTFEKRNKMFTKTDLEQPF